MVPATTIPLLDFQAQYRDIREEVLAAVTRVFDSQQFILGPEVAALEKELAPFCGCERAVGCGSGSDALLLALMACDVGPGDHVITTPFTFFATASAITRLGAVPVFVDIDEPTFNISPAAVRAAFEHSARVKAVIPVHLYGASADMDPILAAARDYGCHVIEDAAQAIGGEYNGNRVGSIGLAGCFSFYPTKNLGGAGEAGLVTTSNTDFADRVATLRVHGSRRRYYHDEVGINSRLDAVQAAVLRVKFKYFEQWTRRRERNARLYAERLTRTPVTAPSKMPWQTRHVWNQYVIRAPERDMLQAHLARQGIGTEVYYPVPLHMQVCFRSLGYREGALPVSERAAREVLALPIAEVTPEGITYICDCIEEFYAHQRT
jgi:dTDP-4-amino-4,6-dideoxygalactose transaminase